MGFYIDDLRAIRNSSLALYQNSEFQIRSGKYSPTPTAKSIQSATLAAMQFAGGAILGIVWHSRIELELGGRPELCSALLAWIAGRKVLFKKMLSRIDSLLYPSFL
jgi:hypothetical protein